MNKTNKASFRTEPSDSSLLHDHSVRKRYELSPQIVEKQENPKAKFVEVSPICPENLTKVAVFNSSGEKSDPSDIFNAKTGHFINASPEGIQLSESISQLPPDREFIINQPFGKEVRRMEMNERNIHGHGDEVHPPAKQRRLFKYKCSRTKTNEPRRKTSQTDGKNTKQVDHKLHSKKTSTESIARSHVSTQTDSQMSYCRKCLLHSPKTQDSEIRHQSSESKIPTKNDKQKFVSAAMENKNKSIKSNNAFCTAVNVTLPGPVLPIGVDTSREASRVASSADLAKNKKGLTKRVLYDKSESIHQEIMNLKKTAEKNASQTIQVSTLKSPLKSLVKTGQIYRQIKKANKNGSLRYMLSMFVFAILLFWLISAIFHFDYVLDIFRTIGRHVSTIPIFITRRKKELSTAEILIKYVASFGRILRSILIGAP